MALPSEVATLMKALDSLQTATTPSNLASFSRTVARAADDLELVCEEAADPSLAKQLTSYIERAREAVRTARKNARAAALKADRSALIEPPTLEPSESQGTAGRLAAEINDALRATAAVVSEEIQRSQVAGDVVDESTRRLRMTTDQHGVYADGIVSGASTLKSIRRTDLVANFVLVLCFALFFVAAAYVANRRIQNSNVATFVVRPAYKIASLPLRITSWVFKSAFVKNGLDSTQTQYPSSSDPQNFEHIAKMAPREPRRIVEGGEYSDGAGGRTLGENEEHGREPPVEAQETPYMSLTQHRNEGTERDVAQHPGNSVSIAEKSALTDRVREDPEQNTVLNDSDVAEQNNVDDGIKKDLETAKVLRDDDSIASGAPINLPESVSDEQSTALLKSSPSSQYQTHYNESNIAHSEQVVPEMLNTEPKGSRSSEDSDDSKEQYQEPFVEIDRENVVDTVQDGGQGLTAEKDLESILSLLLSGHQSIPRKDAGREAGIRATERAEIKSKKGKDDEAYGERSRSVSSESKDDGASGQPELQRIGDEQEYEPLLTIPLPSQDESPHADGMTNGKDDSETVEQNGLQTVEDKGNESPQAENISGRKSTSETKEQNQPQLAKDKGGEHVDGMTNGKSNSETIKPNELQTTEDEGSESPRSDNFSGRESISETKEQNEPQLAKDKGDEYADGMTNGKGNSETIEQNELQTAKDMGSESPQSSNISGREGTDGTKDQNEPQLAKDKGDDYADDMTSGKGSSETMEQNELQTAEDMGSKSSQSDNISGRDSTDETKQQNELQLSKDKTDEIPQAEKVTTGKESGETTAQREMQAAKDKDDEKASKEIPAVSGDTNTVKESEQHDSRESSREKVDETRTVVLSSSPGAEPESKGSGVDKTFTGSAGQKNQEMQDEEEHLEQLPSPTVLVFEGGTDMRFEVVSEKKARYDLSTVCLVPGIDSYLLQISAVSAWMKR